MGWLSVTHVCRSWRNAALAYPRLWTAPAFPAGVKWAEAMLLRSRNAPLHLDFYRAPDSFPFDDCLSEYISRAVTLRIAGRRAGPENKWISLPAPALESLELLHLHYNALNSVSLLDTTTLPFELFGGIAPNLREITVANTVNFFWGSSLLQNVSHLVVGDRFDVFVKYPNHQRPTYDQLLSALATMSRLETLQLASCLPKGPAPTDRAAIELPHLKSLLLKDNVDRCANVLQHLRTPNARLSIIVPLTKEDFAPWEDDQAMVIPALQRHFLAANASIRSTNVLIISFSVGSHHRHPYDKVVVMVDPDPDDWNVERKLEILDDPRNETHVPFYLSNPTWSQDYPPNSVELCANLPLPAIRILALDLPFETWISISGSRSRKISQPWRT
ncbi:hypothetical protein BC834DRAFT_642399 [Gloeopeniophorella convolvens]|nr:hypothetical protein BC834DRAFT_642399 [Gloeopeniophorella convolvens]